MQTYAITGGCGMVGCKLALTLLERDPTCQIRLLDLRAPPEHFPPHRSITYIETDICSYTSVVSSLSGNVNAVFHLASYGMSGKEMLNESMINSVNVQGTRHIITACLELKIGKLIYVSSYNVVFGGNVIINGSEDSLPYYPPEKFCDHYSRTKSIAEQEVLAANCSQLRTCAIRPAAIYGPGEERHLPRTFKNVSAGLASFAIGSEDVLADWVYVDNLVHALILASKALENQSPETKGEAYFVSDDHPVNNFQFLKDIIVGLGYDKAVFAFYIPTNIFLYLAWLTEIIHRLLRPVWHFNPFLSRTEVLKVGVTHWVSMKKAKEKLGYQVIVSPEEGIRKTIEWYSKHGVKLGGKRHADHKSTFVRLIIVTLAMIALASSVYLFLSE